MSQRSSDPASQARAPYAPVLSGDPAVAEDRALGRELAAAGMGLDRLERRLNAGHGPLDTEGLVPIWLGDDLVDVPEYDDWSEADAALAALTERARSLAAGTRLQALEAILTSLRTASALFQGASMSYAEKLEQLVQIPAEPVPADVWEGLRTELDDALTGAGLGEGTFAQRVRRWEDDRALDPEHLEATFRELMREARARTDAMIVPVGDYDMELAPMRDVPYTARCNFSEGRMDLNVDLGFSRAALKHLVAHEVFPGHSTQLLYTRDAVAAGTASADVLLCTLNGATGAVQEGIGDQGVKLIDWVEDADDLVHVALRRLRSAGQARAAWFRMEGGWDDERTRAWLRDEVCGQAAWVEGRLNFAKHPFRGPFIASYWYGDEAVREVRERTADANRGAFIAFLYGRSNSIGSLLRFDPAAVVEAA